MKASRILLYKYFSLIKAFFYKKRLFNFFALMYSYLSRSPSAKVFPLLIQIEPTTKCNLKCALCLVGSEKLKRFKGNMPFDNYKKIVDQLEATTAYLVLYNLGEPLLHPEIYQMAEYAKKKKIFVRLSTHGDFAKKDDAKNLVECGIDELVISLDCPDSQIYERYKKSDGFKRVIKNISLIIKERGKRKKPFIYLQLLVMKDTEPHIHQFQKEAYALGIDRVLFKTLRINFPGIAPDRRFLPENKKYIRRAYQNITQNGRCYRPWISTVILWDGSVVPCCFDMEGQFSFGNILNEHFDKIWNNEKYIYFRKTISRDSNSIPLCSECSLRDAKYDFQLFR